MGNGTTVVGVQKAMHDMSDKDKSLKIGRAGELYVEFGWRSFFSDDRFLFTSSRPLQNSNYLHALCLTEKMFDNTRHSIRIFTGTGCGLMLDSLKQSFRNAIDRIVNNVDDAKSVCRAIIIGDTVPDILSELSQKHPKKVEVQLASINEGMAVRHFLVADRKMLRDEEVHKAPVTAESMSEDIKALVYMDNVTEAGLAESRFDGHWKRLKDNH